MPNAENKQAGYDRGEPIPESRRFPGDDACSFCGGFKHFGWCDEMRTYNKEQARERRPMVNPLVRPG